MADIKFSELPAAVFADLTDTDILPMSDLDVAPALQSKKVTLSLLRQFMLTAATMLTSLTLGAGGAAYNVAGTSTAVAVDAVAGAITHTANLSRGAGAPGTFVFKVGGVLGSSNTLQTAATVLTIGDQVTTFVGTLRSLAGKINLGTTPLTTGAINIDGTTAYSDIALTFVVPGNTVSLQLARMTGAVAGLWSMNGSVLGFGYNSQHKWSVGGAGAVSELHSAQVTARIRMGSTNGIAFQNAAGSADRLTINDAGTEVRPSNGTQSGLWIGGGTSGERLAGWGLQGISGSSGVHLTAVTTAGGTVQGCYWNGTQYYEAFGFASVASGFGTLSLMKSGGNVVISGTAAGATASGVLAFGTIAATEPTATVDLVQLYGFDFGAGQRALGVFQEYAPYAGVAVASTHRWPVRINGTAYYVLVTTVA